MDCPIKFVILSEVIHPLAVLFLYQSHKLYPTINYLYLNNSYIALTKKMIN